MRCNNCGKKLSDDAVICPICGSIVPKQSKITSAPAPTPRQTPVTKAVSKNTYGSLPETKMIFSHSPAAMPMVASEPKKSHAKIVILAALMVIAIFAIIVIYLINHENLSKSKAIEMFTSSLEGKTEFDNVECIKLSHTSNEVIGKIKRAEFKCTNNTMLGTSVFDYTTVFMWDKDDSEWKLNSSDKKDCSFEWNDDSIVGKWQYTDPDGYFDVMLEIEAVNNDLRVKEAYMNDHYFGTKYTFNTNIPNNNLKISKDGYVKVYLNNGKQIIYIDSRGGKSKADGIYILRGTANNRFDLTKTN